MKVRFTPVARNSLREIARYIARDNPVRAVSFAAELRAKAAEIGINPSLYPVHQFGSGHQIRRRVVGRYLILYQVDAGLVVILDIRHGARDPDLLP